MYLVMFLVLLICSKVFCKFSQKDDDDKNDEKQEIGLLNVRIKEDDHGVTVKDSFYGSTVIEYVSRN